MVALMMLTANTGSPMPFLLLFVAAMVVAALRMAKGAGKQYEKQVQRRKQP